MTRCAPTPLVGDIRADVVVLGAGLTGALVALELAERRRQVVVLEPGPLASRAWESGHVATGLGLPYARALERYGRDAALAIWEAHREGHDRLRERLGRLGGGCGYAEAGGFLLAEDRAEAQTLAASEDLLREEAFSGEFLDHYMLEARFDLRGFVAGYWAADDAELDPACLLRLLVAAAAERGAGFHAESPLLDLDLAPQGVEAVTARGRVRAEQAVVALGAGAGRLLPALEARVTPVRLRFARLESAPDVQLPSPARARQGALYWRRGEAGLLLGAQTSGTTEPGALRALAAERLLGVGGALAQGEGEVDETFDALPLVGRLPGLPAVAACGFGGLELSWLAVAARWAAAAATGDDTTPAGFAAARGLV